MSSAISYKQDKLPSISLIKSFHVKFCPEHKNV